MTDPRLEPLAPGLARLLEAERARPGPSSHVAQRVFDRLSASIAALPPVPLQPAEPLSPAPPAAPGAGSLAAQDLHAPLVKAAALVVAGMVGGAGLHAALRPPRVETRVETQVVYLPQEAPAPAVAPDDEVEIALPPAAGPAGPPARATPPRSSLEETRARDRQRAAERVRIEQARTALGRGEASSALSVLARHGRDHPRGQLVEEREALVILSLAADGRRAEARARAAEFRERFPKSMLLRSINSTLTP